MPIEPQGIHSPSVEGDATARLLRRPASWCRRDPRSLTDNQRMNPLLAKLHPYPFERLRALTRDITPNPDLKPISLGIGEQIGRARLNSSHSQISYAVFCLKKKKKHIN